MMIDTTQLANQHEQTRHLIFNPQQLFCLLSWMKTLCAIFDETFFTPVGSHSFLK